MLCPVCYLCESYINNCLFITVCMWLTLIFVQILHCAQVALVAGTRMKNFGSPIEKQVRLSAVALAVISASFNDTIVKIIKGCIDMDRYVWMYELCWILVHLVQ